MRLLVVARQAHGRPAFRARPSERAGLRSVRAAGRLVDLRAARRPTRQTVAPISATRREEDPGLERLQRPVVAWWLVGDEQLQVMREPLFAGEEGTARWPAGPLGSRAALREARRDRRAGADQQIVQLCGADGVAGAIDERGRDIQAFGIGGKFGETLTPDGARDEPDALPVVTRTRTALAASRCGRTQSVNAIRAAMKPSSVAAIAGSVRRVSAPVATPSANAKPA